ncbi:hypothetical protein ABVT39_004245 [Epinephelus coioides]
MAVAPLLKEDETQFSLSVFLCRRPAVMCPPAADDNGTSGPYWPVSCYRCAIPSCRSPRGCSSCLRLLDVPRPPSPPSSCDGVTERQPNQLGPPGQSLPNPAVASGRRWALIYNCHTSWGSVTTAKRLLIKIPLLFFAFDFPKVSLRLEVFSSQD